MGTPRTPLGKATKAADMDNGRSVKPFKSK